MKDCGCESRKAELKEKGIQPLLGSDYTPIDAVQWAFMKAMEKLGK